jgi:mercuric ion transport protein
MDYSPCRILEYSTKNTKKSNMETMTKEPGKTAKKLGLLGIGLCALCCALPIIGIVGGAGILATISLYAEKIALVLLITSAAFFAIWLYRKRQAPPSCSIDCSCKTEVDPSKPAVDVTTR